MTFTQSDAFKNSSGCNKCLLVSNANSGFRSLPSPEELAKVFGVSSPLERFDGTQRISDYSDVIVCGGDGTISGVIEKNAGAQQTVYYMPNGTVNDFGRIKKLSDHPVVGSVNGKRFCYVFATGTLTKIGYSAQRVSKRRFGIFAYLWEAVKAFRVERIPATLTADGKSYNGDFSLIMVLRSPRCFGLKFNKLYNENRLELYLLLVRAPKRGGIVTLFCRYFRAFFLGFGKAHKGKVIFVPAEKINIELYKDSTFCLDGERVEPATRLELHAEKADFRLVRAERKKLYTDK